MKLSDFAKKVRLEVALIKMNSRMVDEWLLIPAEDSYPKVTPWVPLGSLSALSLFGNFVDMRKSAKYIPSLTMRFSII